jgi:spermidine synthase
MAFVTAAVALLVQVLVHRAVAAKLLNNYAFLVISLTMLGFAVSGALTSRFLPRLLERMEAVIWAACALFGLSLLFSSYLFYRAGGAAELAGSRPDFVRTAAHWMPLALLYAVPFAFSGLILGLLLSDPRLPTRRLYAYDLLGSGLGALLVIPVITALGVEKGILLGAAVQLGAGLVLTPPRGRAAGLLLGAAVVSLTAGVVRPQSLFRLRYPTGSFLAEAEKAPEPYRMETAVLDPVARIEVTRIPVPDPARHYYPCLIGTNPAFLSRFERVITQNNYAFTYAVRYDGNPASLQGIEETIYSAAYQVRAVPRPRVVIVGVGGGFDILNAVAFDASDITAVEINAATIDILKNRYRDYFRPWVEDPRLHLTLGEGRHYLATHPGPWDVLQLSGVDSYSGTSGAAHVFSENYLYTAEAFDLYLSRLSPQGVLNMMRLEFPQPREMLRALTSATAALRRAGVDRPADHIITVSATEGNFTAMLVKKTPFTLDEEARVAAWVSNNRFLSLTASPRRLGVESVYQGFLDLEDPARQAAFIAQYPFDVSPATDDRPFFFHYAFWWHLFPAQASVWAAVPTMELSVIMLLALVGTAAWACVHLPLRHLSRTGGGSAPRGRFGLYFAAIAVGYLAVEVALLQKFGLFLGHPNYALSVVLAALLVSTGVGSLISSTIVGRLGRVRYVTYLLAGVILLEYLLLFPRLASGIGLPFATRAALVTLLVAPVGVLLGAFLPSGLERLKVESPAMAPWAWGVNGIFSVLAPILSVALSMAWGIGALFLAAIPVYLVAGFALPDPEA